MGGIFNSTVATSPTYKTIAFSSSGVIVANPAILKNFRVTSGSGISLTLYDSPTTNSGQIIFSATGLSGDTTAQTGLAGSNAAQVTWPSEYQTINGIYASITGTGTFEVDVR